MSYVYLFVTKWPQIFILANFQYERILKFKSSRFSGSIKDGHFVDYNTLQCGGNIKYK